MDFVWADSSSSASDLLGKNDGAADFKFTRMLSKSSVLIKVRDKYQIKMTEVLGGVLRYFKNMTHVT